MLAEISAQSLTQSGDKAVKADKSIGEVFESLTAFKKRASAVLDNAVSSKTYVPFQYRTFHSLVCSNWKTADCPAGVAAEALSTRKDSWVIRAVELRHSRACSSGLPNEMSPHDQLKEQLNTVASKLARYQAAESDMEISLSSSASSDTVDAAQTDNNSLSALDDTQLPSRKLSTASGIKLKLVHRSSSVSTPMRSPTPKAKSSPAKAAVPNEAGNGSPPQLGQSFTNMESFHATAKAYAASAYPDYGIYFRSRKGDRPELYCKYQNSPSAHTTPGLGCKYGFNAKRQLDAEGREVYIVTKAVEEHIPECQKRTSADTGSKLQTEASERSLSVQVTQRKRSRSSASTEAASPDKDAESSSLKRIRQTAAV